MSTINTRIIETFFKVLRFILIIIPIIIFYIGTLGILDVKINWADGKKFYLPSWLL